MSFYEIVGGDIISGWGGYVQLNNWTTTAGPSSSQASSAKSTNRDYIDVANWELIINEVAQKFTMSGSMGATSRRRVCQDWYAKFNVWYDINQTRVSESPMRKLEWRDSVSLTFFPGNVGIKEKSPDPNFQWNAIPLGGIENRQINKGDPGGIDSADLAEVEADPMIYPPRYRSPLGIITYVKTINNVEDIVVQEITVEGNSLIWELINQQDASNYDTYVNKISKRIDNV